MARQSLVAWVLVALGAFANSGCSDDTDTNPNPEPEPEGVEVRASVGPDGGTLEGEEGTELEGVKVVIPEGALSETVDVWIRPTFDPVLLPNLAERVGIQVEIGSDGDLEAPVELTLPFDDGRVDRFGQTADDVKVWVRDGDVWTLVEADDATATRVTITLSEFTKAAAGVKVVPRAAKCGTSCDPSAADHFDTDACAATGACIVAISSSATSDSFDFAVSPRGDVGFLAPAGIGVIAVSHELVSGMPRQSTTQTVSSSLRQNFAFNAAGDLFVGLGSAGNARFPSGNAKPEFLDGGAGLGAVTLGDGTTLRFSKDKTNNLVVTDSASKVVVNHEEQIVATINGAATSTIVSPRDPASFVVVEPTRVRGFRRVNDALNAYLNLSFPSGQSASGQAPAAVALDGSIAVVTQPGAKVVLSRNGGAFDFVSAMEFEAASLAFDADNNLLVTSGTSPEVVVLDQSGLPTGIRLTDAASSDSEFAALIPRTGNGYINAYNFIVMTQSRSFLLIDLQ